MSSRRVIPPYIYCPRCGSQIELIEDRSPETLDKLREQGYTAMARGICECGVVAVLCYQPLPASPTFSLFFNTYPTEVSGRKVILPYVYCPKCGSQIELNEDHSPETLAKLKEQGYIAMSKGICECGVVVALCYQPPPASPTFNLFFDIYPAEVTKEILTSRRRKITA